MLEIEKQIEKKLIKWRKEHPHVKDNLCSKCGTLVSYNEQFDTYYCKKCNVWLEPACSDKNCEYCSKRPKKPKVTQKINFIKKRKTFWEKFEKGD